MFRFIAVTALTLLSLSAHAELIYVDPSNSASVDGYGAFGKSSYEYDLSGPTPHVLATASTLAWCNNGTNEKCAGYASASIDLQYKVTVDGLTDAERAGLLDSSGRLPRIDIFFDYLLEIKSLAGGGTPGSGNRASVEIRDFTTGRIPSYQINTHERKVSGTTSHIYNLFSGNEFFITLKASAYSQAVCNIGCNGNNVSHAVSVFADPTVYVDDLYKDLINISYDLVSISPVTTQAGSLPTAVSVPEPASMSLLLTGALFAFMRKKRETALSS